MSGLVEVPVEEVPDNHPEVVAMAAMTVEEMSERLRPGTNRRTRYLETCKYWEKVENIIHALDKSANSEVSVAEASRS